MANSPYKTTPTRVTSSTRRTRLFTLPSVATRASEPAPRAGPAPRSRRSPARPERAAVRVPDRWAGAPPGSSSQGLSRGPHNPAPSAPQLGHDAKLRALHRDFRSCEIPRRRAARPNLRRLRPFAQSSRQRDCRARRGRRPLNCGPAHPGSRALGRGAGPGQDAARPSSPRRSTSSFGRVQFTPDLLPADITGTDVLERSPSRRPPRAQLLAGTDLQESGARRRDQPHPAEDASRVASGHARAARDGRRGHAPLPDPFQVFATRNPIEQEGTYPLPEAQLDRFLLEVHVEYPTRGRRARDRAAHHLGHRSQIEPRVLGVGRARALSALVPRVPVTEQPSSSPCA